MRLGENITYPLLRPLASWATLAVTISPYGENSLSKSWGVASNNKFPM